MNSDPARPLRVYGSEISYFTGKLEGYLRYKEIPYERIATTRRHWQRIIPKETGVAQMPAVELPDGRWITDTTPIIDWLETQWPEPAVIPRDPLQGFVSRLLEDYADEWLWRPALHYRWSYRGDALLLSRKIVDEILADLPLPGPLKRLAIRLRQQRGYVRGDGVTACTRSHVEDVYLKTLAHLEAILATRPFLFGERPTLADFGFFASMFRHFGLDPTPSAIMRSRAPAVWEWVARVWNARASRTRGALSNGIPNEWGPILDEIGSAYLPYLCANAEAWKAKQRRFDVTIQSVPYQDLPTSRYRVWCLERLRVHCNALAEAARREARALLERHGCWEPLWRVVDPDSGHDPEGRAPFAHGINVF
ncbi:MAG: glutathione S-transferase family protein [Deltaproteobacteria bacterium]|nr:glutathione S-transferase family protein [Deltaproteobacteria bacterium]MBI3388732.1 glutathione S-transferase family protein [Deltaproteobacteria bacterium]